MFLTHRDLLCIHVCLGHSRNIYYIKEEDGELVTGTIVSDGSVAIISFAEDINVRERAAID